MSKSAEVTLYMTKCATATEDCGLRLAIIEKEEMLKLLLQSNTSWGAQMSNGMYKILPSPYSFFNFISKFYRNLLEFRIPPQ